MSLLSQQNAHYYYHTDFFLTVFTFKGVNVLFSVEIWSVVLCSDRLFGLPRKKELQELATETFCIDLYNEVIEYVVP